MSLVSSPEVGPRPATDRAGTSTQVGGRDGRAAGRRTSWLPALSAAAAYGLVAVVAYRQVLFSGNARLPICACGDQAQETWFLRWPLFAVTHGLDPFVTTWINYPKGTNLVLNTSMPLLGFVSSPLQLTLGPVAAYDILLAAAMAGSALAMCLALRRWVRWWPAAFLGGLFYGFSPFMTGEGQGHLFVTAAFVPPLVLVLLDDIVVRQAHSAGRDGVLLGVLVVVEYLISPEVLAMMVLVAACGVAVVAVANLGQVRQRLRHAVTALAIGGAVACVALAYPLWVSLFGPQHIVGPPHPLADLALYPGDLLGPIIPTGFQYLAPASIKLHGNMLSGANPAENGMYLGIPLVAALAGVTWWFRRARTLVFFVVMLVVSMVLTLGPRLTIDGHDTGVRMPFTVIRHVPLLQDIFPLRFSLFIQLFAAASVAMGAEMVVRLRARPARAHRLLRSGSAAALGVVALLPLVPAYPYGGAPTSIPSFYSSPAVDRIPAGSVVLAYPYARTPEFQPLLGQAVAGMRFKLVGGTTFIPGPDGRSEWGPDVLSPATVQAIFYNAYAPTPKTPPSSLRQYPPLDATTIGALRTFLVRYHISTVVIDPVGANPGAVVRYVTATLGPGRRTGGVLAWFDVPRLLRTVQPAPPGG